MPRKIAIIVRSGQVSMDFTYANQVQEGLNKLTHSKPGVPRRDESRFEVRIFTSSLPALTWLGDERGVILFTSQDFLAVASNLLDRISDKVKLIIATGDPASCQARA